MSYLTNNIPLTKEEWDVLWKQICKEHDLKTDRDCYGFLAKMVLEITSVIVKTDPIEPQYEQWRTFVNFVFEQWTYHDVRLNKCDD